jgi:HEPN domain-containing protein
VNRARDWLKQAERDLAAASVAAGAGFHEWAAFCAQQSAEKAVKGVLESLAASSRGHSITGMLRRLEERLSVPEAVWEAARELDQVYVTARYPNGFAEGSPGDYFSETTSSRLLTHAHQVVEFCRGQLSRSGPGA